MLLKVKRVIAGILFNFYDKLYFKRFQTFLSKNQNSTQLFIFDLDNTLAHTYPYLHKKNKIKMYKSLPLHKPMVDVAIKTLESGTPSLILTAREYKYKNATREWLTMNLQQKDIPLFIVLSAKDKLKYLQEAIKSFSNVTYYDDLSYNHENGDVKFYTDVIAELEKMPITYIGYDTINEINDN